MCRFLQLGLLCLLDAVFRCYFSVVKVAYKVHTPTRTHTRTLLIRTNATLNSMARCSYQRAALRMYVLELFCC